MRPIDDRKKGRVLLIRRDRTFGPGSGSATTDETALKTELEAKGYAVDWLASGQISGGTWGSQDGLKIRSASLTISDYDFIVCCWDSEYIDWCSYCASPCGCPSDCSTPAKLCVVCSP